MVPQDTDFPNPVADAPPQAQEEEDTNAVVSPTHSDFLLTKIGAKVAALPFVWAFFAVMGVQWDLDVIRTIASTFLRFQMV